MPHAKEWYDRVCFYNTEIKKCYASCGSSEFRSAHGYPCHRLRITEGCTVFWIPYVAKDHIHPWSVIADHMLNGDKVYVTFKFNYPPIISLAGHYADFTTGPASNVAWRSSTVMMLIGL